MKMVKVLVIVVLIAIVSLLAGSSYGAHGRYRGERVVNADRKWVDGSGTYHIYLQGKVLYIPKGPLKGYWHPVKDDPNRWFGDKGIIVLRDGRLYMPDSEVFFPTN